MWKQAAFLNHITSVTPKFDCIPFDSGFAFNQDTTRRWIVETVDELQCGRLSAARFTKQDQGLASFDYEIQIVDD
jgi:hypothetical protein